ncbi:MAG: hypothetical protein ACOX9R_09430 [Armatimonadota bacterium]|jgi:hypothetical protein
MRSRVPLLLAALLVIPTAALATATGPADGLVDLSPSAFPLDVIPATHAMSAPQVIHCVAHADGGHYRSVSAVITDGPQVMVAFLSTEGYLLMTGEAAMVAPAALQSYRWSRVLDAVGAVTEVLGDHSRRLGAPLPSTGRSPAVSLTDRLGQLIEDAMTVGWRFRECLIDLPYDLARAVIKSQVPPEFAPLVDAVIDGIRLFHSGSPAGTMLEARPHLRQTVYGQIVSGLRAGRDVPSIQSAVLGTLGVR